MATEVWQSLFTSHTIKSIPPDINPFWSNKSPVQDLPVSTGFRNRESLIWVHQQDRPRLLDFAHHPSSSCDERLEFTLDITWSQEEGHGFTVHRHEENRRDVRFDRILLFGRHGQNVSPGGRGGMTEWTALNTCQILKECPVTNVMSWIELKWSVDYFISQLK